MQYSFYHTLLWQHLVKFLNCDTLISWAYRELTAVHADSVGRLVLHGIAMSFGILANSKENLIPGFQQKPDDFVVAWEICKSRRQNLSSIPNGCCKRLL